MKKIILLFTIILSNNSFAQLNNPDFENWDSLQGFIHWTTSGFGMDSTHDAYQGNSALEIWTWYTYAYGYAHNGQPVIGFDYIKAGTPYTQKATSLNGYYKFDTTNVLTPDSALAVVMLKRYNTTTHTRDTVGLGFGYFTATNTYTPFTVNIIDKMPGINPDSIFVMFATQRRAWDLGSGTNTCNSLTNDCAYLKVDDITLSTPTGIDQLQQLFSPEVYPNPANEFIKFNLFSVNNPNSTLTIFNSLGQTIYKHTINQKEILIDIRSYNSGLYYYSVADERHIISNGKFVVTE